jgi:hypothetical protein
MNYTITINDKSYVVLNCINPVEAVEKLTAEMNDNHLDIKIDMVEGDVIPVNTTSVHSTPVVEPAPAPEPETHHQLAVSNNVGKSNNLTTDYQPISTANTIPQAPVSEPVGYFNAPPVAPPPQRVMSPMEERMELVRHMLLNKMTENHIRIPNNLQREISNWWYNAITNVMVYVDGFKFINPVNSLHLKNDETGSTVTTRINGELPTGEKHEQPIPVGYRFDINDTGALIEFSLNQKDFVIIDVDFKNMVYEIARFPETLRNMQISEKYIDHVIAPLMLETFHERKR